MQLALSGRVWFPLARSCSPAGPAAVAGPCPLRWARVWLWCCSVPGSWALPCQGWLRAAATLNFKSSLEAGPEAKFADCPHVGLGWGWTSERIQGKSLEWALCIYSSHRQVPACRACPICSCGDGTWLTGTQNTPVSALVVTCHRGSWD